MFLASDEATSGSVMANAERISPASSGFSHRSFCSAVPTRSSTSMLPVSGRAAVEALRRQRVLAELLGDVGVVEVRQPLTGLGVGQEEVPQAVGLGLRLHAVEQLELALAVAPVLGPALAEAVVLGRDRLDLVLDERLHRFVERDGVLGHRQVQGVVGGDAGVHSWCGHGGHSFVIGGSGVERDQARQLVRGRLGPVTTPGPYGGAVLIFHLAMPDDWAAAQARRRGTR